MASSSTTPETIASSSKSTKHEEKMRPTPQTTGRCPIDKGLSAMPPVSTWGPAGQLFVGRPPLFPQIFIVHQNLIGYFSPYFQRAFDRHARINLAEVEAEVVEDYLSWLYTRRPTYEAMYEQKSRSYIRDMIPRLCKLYIFAERHDTPLLKDSVIDALFECIGKYYMLTKDIVTFTIHNTSSDSLIWSFFIDMLLELYGGQLKKQLADCNWDFPPEFLIRLADAAFKSFPTDTPGTEKIGLREALKRRTEAWYSGKCCVYHYHI